MNGICDTWCAGCEYLNRVGEPYCDYIGITFQIRPCPAGNGCTVRSRQAKYQTDKRLTMTEDYALRLQKRVERARNRAEYEKKRRHEKERKVIQEGTYRGQGDAIRAYRAAHKYTQRDLAKILNVSQSSVDKWERELCLARWGDLETIGCKKDPGGTS